MKQFEVQQARCTEYIEAVAQQPVSESQQQIQVKSSNPHEIVQQQLAEIAKIRSEV